MKIVKGKKLIEENEKKRNNISNNIGIISSSFLLLSTIQEILKCFYGKHSRTIAIFVGVIALTIFIICMKYNVSKYITNNKNMRNVNELCTFIAIVNFIIINIMINSMDKMDIYGGIFLISYDVIMAMIYALWTFCFRKDRHWNVD